MAIMAFHLLHGFVPPYLNDHVRVANLPDHRQLRSLSSYELLVPPFRLIAVGQCTFPVAAACISLLELIAI